MSLFHRFSGQKNYVPEEIMASFIKIREGAALYLRHQLAQRKLPVDEDALSATFEHLISGSPIPDGKSEKCTAMIAVLKEEDAIFTPFKQALAVKSKLMAMSGELDELVSFGTHVIGSKLQHSGSTPGPEEFILMANQFYSDCQAKYGTQQN